MKKTILSILTVLLISFSVNAQDNSEEVDFMQSIFGMEKKALVEGFIDPSPETAPAFWELYDSYEADRKSLGKERIDLLVKYVESYGKTTDDQVNEMMTEILSLGKANDKLIGKYYKKMKKSTNAVEAAEFFQIESYILSQIRVEIFESIPFIGEFK